MVGLSNKIKHCLKIAIFLVAMYMYHTYLSLEIAT